MAMQIKDADSAAIYQAASDYYGGWYEADAERMERCLHPGLAKRAVRKDTKGREFLHDLTKEQMVEKTRQGGDTDTPAAKRQYHITIMDRYEEIAAVKVVANEYVDYLQLAKHDGQWIIVNALWTDNRARR